MQEGLGKSVKILNLFARTDNYFNTQMNTDLVIRAKKSIKKSREIVHLTGTVDYKHTLSSSTEFTVRTWSQIFYFGPK